MVGGDREVVQRDAPRRCSSARPGGCSYHAVEARLPLSLCSEVTQPRKAEHNPSSHARLYGTEKNSAHAGHRRCRCDLVDVKAGSRNNPYCMPPGAPKPRFFASPADWRAWLEKYHADTEEVWVGLY